MVKGVSLAALGAGQLLIQGAKRLPSHRLVIGRGRAAVNPQSFAWEQLRAPVLAEDFDEVRARLGVLPPSSLRPRRVAEDFHVVAVTTVKEFSFDTAAQTVRAILVDARKDTAALEHPFSSRGREGAELLLDRLEKHQPESLRFIAGPARLGPRGLMFFPTALVFQDGASRQIVQPWVDRVVSQTRASELTRGSATTTQPADPIDDYSRQLLNALSELALLGLQRADTHAARSCASSPVLASRSASIA